MLQLQTRLTVLVDDLVEQAHSDGGLGVAPPLPMMDLDLNLDLLDPSEEASPQPDAVPSQNA